MNIRKTYIAALAASLISGAALAQGAPQNATQADTQRDINQQQRIEQGLQSGQLNTKEAGQLERQQQHIDNMQARDLKNGAITPAEQARLNAAQNHASQSIYDDKHNGVGGNPDSKSSERMQADVQRNVNQEQRIENGEKAGQLNNRQVGRLEHGQARVDRKEANAAANGHVGAAEQRNIQRAENHQSHRIHHARKVG
ncbi:MAG: hypothetical protein OSA97_20705 [Nevskia sp.]|nr:hypothetical protein [Nevskia sp.]